MAKINDEQAAQYALIAMAAEDMLDPSHQVLAPALPAALAKSWQLVGHMTALNALLGVQKIGLGDRVYYGFLARSTQDATQYLAVVRGTEEVIEWIEDLEGLLIAGPPVGLVEQGFYSIYESMRYLALGAGASTAATAPLAAAGIAAVLPAGAAVTVIGHSLGSAIASYLMADLARGANGKFAVGGSLFACPKPGDAAFARNVDAVVGAANYVVYNYIRDIVPHVPPSLPLGLGFQPLPQTTWIQPAKAQAKIKNDPVCNHHAYCYAAMLDYTAVQAMSPASVPCILGKG
ncbi:MAG TPA: lipase family protein [Rudaea sp.]|nr:lipase family protein [Rudaea sp.]